MEEINLVELFKYFLKRLHIIIIAFILAMVVGFIYVRFIKVPLYHGETTVILVPKEDSKNNASLYQSEINTNEKLVTTYSEIVKSRKVVNKTIKNLGLDTTYNELVKNISVTSVSDTSIIKITVSDPNNKEAVRIADEVAKVFEEEVKQIYKMENISVIDKAVVNKNPYNISTIKTVGIFGIGAIVVVCGIIFVIFYFDTTVKNAQEIEEKLDLPVLGSVPVVRKLDKERKKKNKARKVVNK